MEKLTTIINKNTTKELIKNTFVLSIVALIVGLVMIGLYILFGALNNSWLEPLQIILVVLAVILLVLAVVIILSYVGSLSKMKNYVRKIVYDFQDEFILFDIYKDEELIEQGKVYYQDLIEYKETKNFIFIKLSNNTWLSFSKVDGLVEFFASKGLTKFKAVKANRK